MSLLIVDWYPGRDSFAERVGDSIKQTVIPGQRFIPCYSKHAAQEYIEYGFLPDEADFKTEGYREAPYYVIEKDKLDERMEKGSGGNVAITVAA